MEKCIENDLKILLKADEIQSGIAKLGAQINEDFANEELYLICILRGAVMFTVDLAKHLKMPVKMEFVRLSSYGTSRISSGNVKAKDISLPDLNGKNVLIIDDIIDTGHTAKFMLDFINDNYRVKNLKYGSLLDKKSRRQINIEPDYCCFAVEDKFLVGYGMDYNECYRNIPYIGYLSEN